MSAFHSCLRSAIARYIEGSLLHSKNAERLGQRHHAGAW